MKKKKKSAMKAWGIGAGITAATLAAATGAYLLSNKKTKAKAKKWAIVAKKEVIKNAKLAKKLGQKEYGFLVDQALKRSGSLEKISAADIIAAGKELKGQWKGIQAHAKKMAKAHKPARKTAKHHATRAKKSRA